MSSVLGTYARKAISFKEGKGSYLFAENGDKYLDFVQGIGTNILGHCHEHLVSEIQVQSKKLWHVSNAFIIPEQEKLAKRLTDNTFADFVCFQNSGTEATEASIKIARKYFHNLFSCYLFANTNPARQKTTEINRNIKYFTTMVLSFFRPKA